MVENAVDGISVMIARKAGGARLASWRYVIPPAEWPRIAPDDSGSRYAA
jgi:hypothetical protein